jgi:hypothetical protein
LKGDAGADSSKRSAARKPAASLDSK